MDLRTAHVEPTGIDVRYYRAGAGEPLLYLHHLAGLQGWEPALAKLAESFDVIAPFAPGWGPAKDDLPAIDPGPLDLTLYHADLLDTLRLDAVNLVGISIGGWMAAELAAILPHRVKKLVLVNPLGLWLDDAPGEDPFAQHPMQPTAVLFSDPAMRERFLMQGKDQLESIVREMLDLRAGAKFLWPIPDTGVAKRLARIKAPTLVVTSDQDRVVPAAHGPAWQRQIPGAQLTTMPGAGHLAELEQPDTFAEIVAEFVAHGRVAALTA